MNKKIKILIFGNLLNNLYLLAKSFNTFLENVEITQIADPYQDNSFGQPEWNDLRFKLQSNSKKELNNINYIWEKPKWYHSIKVSNETTKLKDFRKNFISTSFIKQMNKINYPYYNYIIEQMRKNDVSIVCGDRPEYLAYISAKPYVILPHGEDLRLAFGLKKNNFLYHKILQASFKNALFITGFSPTVYSHYGSITEFKKCHNINNIQHLLTVPCEIKKRRKDKLKLLTNLSKELSDIALTKKIDLNKTIIFIPSRINFHVKKTDIMLDAINRYENIDNFCFIFSGWGTDLNKITTIISKNINYYVLPYVISKPILYDFMNLSDIVVDQFGFGTYGMSAVEAMSIGTPVMMYINNLAYELSDKLAPPVLNAKNTDDILQWFDKISNAKIDLELKSKESIQWVQLAHSPEQNAQEFLKAILSSLYKNM